MTYCERVFRPRYFWLLVFVLFFLPKPAEACDCVTPPPPCKGVVSANKRAAFSGTVTEIRLVDDPPIRVGGRMVTQFSFKVRFTVDEAFTPLSNAEITVTNDASDCAYPFKVSERYLVYAYRSADDGTLHVTLCSGTKPLASAFDDIELLRAARTGHISTRIFGQVSVGGGPPPTGTRVVATRGRAEYVATTDPDGRYRFRNLPFGRYTLRAWLYDDFYREHWLQPTLSEKETCAEANF